MLFERRKRSAWHGRNTYAPFFIYAPNGLYVYNWHMRANVNIDTDAYSFASTYANARGIPLGAAISELLRRAEQSPEPPSSMLRTNHLGLLVKAKTSQVVTPEMVKELSEDAID